MPLAKTKTVVVRPLLIDARKKTGMSVKDLADRVGVDPSYIFLLEQNKKTATVDVWLKIQEALKLKDRDMWNIINTTKRINRKGF